MPSQQVATRTKRENDWKRDWRAYQFTNTIVDSVRDGDAKRVRSTWFGQRMVGDLTIFLAIGDPTHSGHPSYVASRVDWRGETVLDQVHDEHCHDLRTFKLGAWQSAIRKLQRQEARNG